MLFNLALATVLKTRGGDRRRRALSLGDPELQQFLAKRQQNLQCPDLIENENCSVQGQGWRRLYAGNQLPVCTSKMKYESFGSTGS
jgi:hypothetical protein